MYSGELNRPTKEEMAAKNVPLTQMAVYGDEKDKVPYYPTFAELKQFMVKYGIPQDAHIVYGSCGSHTIELDW